MRTPARVGVVDGAIDATSTGVGKIAARLTPKRAGRIRADTSEQNNVIKLRA
jgi:hypothetical protein